MCIIAVAFQTKERGQNGTTTSLKTLRINLGFPGNCPPTPPLSQHFSLSEKLVLMLA